MTGSSRKRHGADLESAAGISRRDLLALAGGTLLSSCGLRAPRPEGTSVHPVPEPATIAAAPPIVRPTILPRSRWTSEPVGINSEAMGPIRRITLHHTGEHASSAGLDDVELIQRIENHHRRNLGWAAIGYHYLVGKTGMIYEGRPLRLQGAHCGGDNNKHNLGITVIGEFHDLTPGRPQLAALASLLADACRRYGIERSEILGHRDIRTTICPGDQLYAWLLRYRQGQDG